MKIASRSLLKIEQAKPVKFCKLRINKSKVNIKTTAGDIHVELFKKESPTTVDNFIKYVDKKHYNETIFHRIISNFMIQGGQHKADGGQNEATLPPIKSESDNGLKNDRGTIAMARTNDPNSARAQFFINVRNNNNLNESKHRKGYTVFGKVIKGMEVVDKIRTSKTNNKNWPLEPVKILEISYI